MRIGFVAEPYEEQNASGMGFVISELLKNMLQQGSKHEFTVYSSKTVSKDFIPGKYKIVSIPRGFLKKWWWFFRMPYEIDVLLFAAPLLPLVPTRSIRSIVICQELASQKIQPKGFVELAFVFVRDRILMPLCLRNAERIIAASQATKKDLLEFYTLPTEKIVVIYDGYQDLSGYEVTKIAVDEKLKPYFFFAGKVKYRKNVHGIAQAFVDFKKRTGASVQLVVAGDYGGEYYEDIMRSLRKGGVDTDVHFIGYTVGAKLYAYFKNALAVVFPSINEGFGMPIIEAMSIGTPVITSKISSMAEAAGDAAILVDPFDVSDISRAMERVYRDEHLRKDLIQKGYVRAKNFSWQKATQEFLSVVEGYAT